MRGGASWSHLAMFWAGCLDPGECREGMPAAMRRPGLSRRFRRFTRGFKPLVYRTLWRPVGRHGRDGPTEGPVQEGAWWQEMAGPWELPDGWGSANGADGVALGAGGRECAAVASTLASTIGNTTYIAVQLEVPAGDGGGEPAQARGPGGDYAVADSHEALLDYLSQERQPGRGIASRGSVGAAAAGEQRDERPPAPSSLDTIEKYVGGQLWLSKHCHF